MTIPLTDAPRVDAGRGPVLSGGEDPPELPAGSGWPDRSAFWADDLAPWLPAFVGRARD